MSDMMIKVNSCAPCAIVNCFKAFFQVWILSCMGFVFIAVLEYVSMLYLMRFALKKPTLPRRPRKNLLQTHPTTSAEEDGLMRAGRIDKCTLFLMPSVFLLFNVWYWTLF